MKFFALYFDLFFTAVNTLVIKEYKPLSCLNTGSQYLQRFFYQRFYIIELCARFIGTCYWFLKASKDKFNIQNIFQTFLKPCLSVLFALIQRIASMRYYKGIQNFNTFNIEHNKKQTIFKDQYKNSV